MFLTKDEEYTENLDSPKDEDYILANDDDLETQSDDYQCGCMNYLSAQQKQYYLRSRDVPVNPIKKRKEESNNDLPNNHRKGKEHADQNHSNINQPSTSSATKDKDTQKKDIRDQIDRINPVIKEVDKATTFNLEN